jgi:hypothetical protein
MNDIEVLAHKYFQVQLPVMSIVLKSAFRRAAKELHTDTGGDKQAFIEMKATYDRIQEMGLVMETDASVPKGAWKLLRTQDGTPLNELGLGLGPTTNGKDCVECGGKGYRTFHHQSYVTCKCGWGCAKCSFRGRYPVGDPSPRYMTCGGCNGAGEIKIYNPVILKGAMSQAQRKRQK